MIDPTLARIRSFEVVPALPEPLKPLLEIAHNLWWSWHPEAVELFLRLDRGLWSRSHHNPVKMLGMAPQALLDAAARDEGYLLSLERAFDAMKRHLVRPRWLQRHHPQVDPGGNWQVAYFCSEFGLTESLQIYSGGLGCLAGDHLKSASELGLPLVAVGLLYRNGYFQQYLAADGWQQEYLPDLDFANLPVSPVKDAQGRPVTVSVALPGRTVTVAVWRVVVGRIDLYLLDTNLPVNRGEDRAITNQLYGGDMEHRIKQELVLGIGGVRALKALGIRPDVCHMNEGHSAFLALERIADLIAEHDVSFDEAREYAAASHVFTTHTPVPAGIDRFPPEMIRTYFKDDVQRLRLDMEGLLALGRENVFNGHEPFSMATLAIRTSGGCNGVSALHGEISRSMWHGIWPQVPQSEVPIGHVTNGVHARSWLSADLSQIFDRYLGGRWQDNPADPDAWQAVEEIPDEELWRIHSDRRQRLIVWVKRQLRQQLAARGLGPGQIRSTCDALSDTALTIGFARRFATYKRGNLLLRDAQRLLRLLGQANRPIQFLIAGKAHPADGGGKDLIRQLVKFSEENELGHRIVFVENYDIQVARYLVQGCDVWLNTPRRGMEASGTSGMKAALNGVLNCSILDGWWDEAYEQELGWAIGRRENYVDPNVGDEIESRALYDLLENQIVPMFYQRDEHGVPREWVRRMKRCIATLAPAFNTNRMVQDYALQYYLPALRESRRLGENALKASVALARQKQRLREHWAGLKVESVKVATARPLVVRQPLAISAVVQLGGLTAPEVRVQAYTGPLDNDGRLGGREAVTLALSEELGDGRFRFQGELSAENSGRHGLAIRILPAGEGFERSMIPGLIHWETPAADPAAASDA